jgi:hypothetical protein
MKIYNELLPLLLVISIFTVLGLGSVPDRRRNISRESTSESSNIPAEKVEDCSEGQHLHTYSVAFSNGAVGSACVVDYKLLQEETKLIRDAHHIYWHIQTKPEDSRSDMVNLLGHLYQDLALQVDATGKKHRMVVVYAYNSETHKERGLWRSRFSSGVLAQSEVSKRGEFCIKRSDTEPFEEDLKIVDTIKEFSTAAETFKETAAHLKISYEEVAKAEQRVTSYMMDNICVWSE